MTVSPESFLLRLVSFRWACTSARSRLDLCYCNQQASGGPAHPRRLAVAFAVRLHISRLTVFFSWSTADADNV